MFLLSKKFLGLLAATTLLLFGGGGLRVTQGLRCWECSDCDPKTNPGESVECPKTGEPERLSCTIDVDIIKSPLKTTITRTCCDDCDKYEMGKCTDPLEDKDSKHEYCFCNATDNCNKDQIAGIPAAWGALSFNGFTIFFTITTIMILCQYSFS